MSNASLHDDPWFCCPDERKPPHAGVLNPHPPAFERSPGGSGKVFLWDGDSDRRPMARRLRILSRASRVIFPTLTAGADSPSPLAPLITRSFGAGSAGRLRGTHLF